MLSVVIAIFFDSLLIFFIAWLICLPTEDTYYYGEKNEDENEKKYF